MLIWDFEVDTLNLSLTAANCLVKAEIPSSVNTLVSMPYLDPNSVDCNCAKSSKRGKILRSTRTALLPQLPNYKGSRCLITMRKTARNKKKKRNITMSRLKFQPGLKFAM